MASGGISIRGLLRVLLLLPGLILPAACGGQGTLVAGGGTGGTGISTGSITAVGSITVNGVRFDIPDNATVRPEGTDLLEGKIVVVRGEFHPDGVSGTASDIKVEREVRGAVTATGSDNFTVLGQTVVVTGATVFAGAQQLWQIVAGDPVEVHGFRNPAGAILASRVELLAGLVEEEVRGPVADLTEGTFSIGGATFTFDEDTEIVPERAAFEDGAIVEVRLDADRTRVNRIEVEDERDPVFAPADGEKFEVEGFVSDFTNPDAPFAVGGRMVDGSKARIKGGLPSELRDGILVEAKGRYAGGVLVAKEIELEDSVEIEATAIEVE